MIISSLLGLQLAFVGLTNQGNTFANLSGGSGLLRTYSAKPNEPKVFGISLMGSFFSKDPFINDIKSSRSSLRLSGNYTFNFGIPFEIYGGLGFTFNENSTALISRTMTTYLENTEIGYRVGWGIGGKTLYLGSFGHVTALSGSRALRNTSGGLTTKSGPPIGGTIGFTETLDLREKWESFPLRQHLNIAYRLPNSDLAGNTGQDFARFSLDTFKYQAIVYALGFEAPYKKFTPFIEYWGEYAIGGSNPSPEFKDNRMKATVGSRWTPIAPVSVIAAVDIGFGSVADDSLVGIPKNPPWEVWFGINFQADGLEGKAPMEGSLRGSVLDDKTGLPLDGVQVIIVSESQLPQTTDLSGSFAFDKLIKGDYEISFLKPGYEPLKRRVTIQGGKDTLMEARMFLIGPKFGSITAQVIDRETQAPIARAFVNVSGVDNPLATDEQGRFRANQVMEGTQNVRVEAPGYKQGSFDVDIRANEATEKQFFLDKAPSETGVCAGVVKNPDGTPLTAVITQDGVNSIAPSGTNPLTGEFQINLLPGQYQFKVIAENYLPQTIDCDVKPGERSDVNITLEKPKEAVLVDNKIILPDAIYFEFGSAKIKEESHPILDQVFEILSANQNYRELNVDGHTDDIGSNAFNLKLSRQRSESVKQYLVDKGLSSDKIKARGFGESKPVATNLTDEGRAENRRVEFNVVPLEEKTE